MFIFQSKPLEGSINFSKGKSYTYFAKIKYNNKVTVISHELASSLGENLQVERSLACRAAKFLWTQLNSNCFFPQVLWAALALRLTRGCWKWELYYIRHRNGPSIVTLHYVHTNVKIMVSKVIDVRTIE